MSASLVTCSMRVRMRMRMWMRMRLRMRISAPSVSALVFLLSRLSLIVRRISERRYQIEFVSSNSLFRFSVVSRRLRSASRFRECLLFRGGPSERVLVPPIDGKDVFADKSDFAEKSCSREVESSWRWGIFFGVVLGASGQRLVVANVLCVETI